MRYTTPQKQALAEVIKKASRPLTAAEICAEAQHEVPTLGIATAYRALRQFVEEGQVRLVAIPGVQPHYESVAQHHHHFFCCDRCHRLFNLLGCLRGVLGLAPEGFSVERHEIVLYGACSECRGDS